MKFSWYKTGFLEIILLTVLLFWIAFRYQYTLNHLHPEWVILGFFSFKPGMGTAAVYNLLHYPAWLGENID